MKLAKKLYAEHLFVVKAYDVSKNIAIFRAKSGAIFCVFGGTNTIKKYFLKGGPALSILHCSHDLTQNKPDQMKRLVNLLEDTFPGRNVALIVFKIKLLTNRLQSINYSDMMDRAKQKQSVNKVLKHAEG